MSMIINKTDKRYETQSHRIYPENWNDEGWLPVPPDLESKVTENFPYFEIVLSDDEMEIVDIVATEPDPPDIDSVRQEKFIELSEACNAAIDAGTTVTLPDGTQKSFAYTLEDQANFSDMFMACVLGAQSYPYHSDDGSCISYTAAEIKSIYGTLSMYKTGQLTYHNQLKQYVKSLSSYEDVEAVTYGQPLTGDYLTTYNERMAEAQEQMLAVLNRIGGAGDETSG